MNRQSQNPILRDKGEFTKFQILFEVMRNQPHVKQKDISDAIGITIQAVSKYFKKLMKEGLLESGSERADYRLTPKALEKLREDIKYLERYVTSIKREMKVEHYFPAMATKPIKKGEKVGLTVKKGILYAVASSNPESEAFGIATTDASRGEDVGLKDLQGKLKMKQGKIVIVKLPSIKQGGSRAVDVAKVRAFYEEFQPDRIGVMGAVGRAILNKLGLKAEIEFGISRAAALAASRGLNVFVLVVGRMVNRVIEEIDATNMKSAVDIIYEVKDGRIT
ncbi:winged helix-turn-helix transcriptional regulator [Candidatus Bathyarchaeota archaeon]|nr:winged helix-turn-helix transcriptional regulator [Candidatus Bathyarchaeota archaeon]